MKAQVLNQINKFRNNKVIHALSFAYIQSESITVSDLELYYKAKHGITVKGAGLVNVEQFIKIAKKTVIEFISFADKKCTIDTNKGVFTLQTEDVNDFPIIPRVNSAVGIISGELLKDYSQFTSTDDLRPAMCGMFISETGELAATNAHYLRWNDTIDYEYNKPVIVCNSALDKVDKANEYWLMDTDKPEYFALASDTETIIFRLIDETFPNYKVVIPTGNDKKVILNKKLLIDAIESAKIATSTATKQIKLTSYSGKVHVESEDIDFCSEYLSPEIGTTEDMPTIGFNADYLKLITSNVNSEIIDVQMSTANRAVIMNSNMLLMPVMLNNY